MTYLVILNLQ